MLSKVIGYIRIKLTRNATCVYLLATFLTDLAYVATIQRFGINAFKRLFLESALVVDLDFMKTQVIWENQNYL